jgi:hypothetical protein
MTGLYRSQNTLIRSTFNSTGHWIGKRLFPDFEKRWALLVDELEPWVANSTVRGFHIGDELCWGGLPFADLDRMATMVAATVWASPPAEPLIIYCNEAAGPIVHDIDAFGVKVNYTHVPRGIDWVSFDFYNPPAAYVRKWYEQNLYPKMSSHQRALLVPDASTSAHLRPNKTMPDPGWTVDDMVDRAWEYFEWAATDQSGKLIGLNPWHWRTVPFTGNNYWELGIESIPPLQEAYSAIGKAILKNNQLGHSTASKD